MSTEPDLLDPYATVATVRDWTIARSENAGEPAFREVGLLERCSRTGHFPYWDRFDVYFAAEAFDLSKKIRWRLAGPNKMVERVDDFGRRRKMLTAVAEPEPGLDATLARSKTVRMVLGLLGSYHVLSSQQLAAMGGGRSHTVRETLKEMYDAGLVYRGWLATGGAYTAPIFYKLHTGARLSRLLRSLSDEETLRITAGDQFTPAPLYDRHNLLSAELGLRLGEVHENLQAVFGENLANPNLMLPGGVTSLTARGDLVAVRGDGLRVVFEVVQASTEDQLAEKMARWGNILKSAHWNELGIVVVFVSAWRKERHAGPRLLLKAHRKAINADGLGENGVPATPAEVQRARAAIQVAWWEDWFPQPWRTSEDFAALRTVFTPDGQTWRRVALAHGEQGGLPFRPAVPGDWQGPRDLGRDLYQVPSWLNGPVRSTMTPAADIPESHRPFGEKNRLLAP